MTLLKDTIFNMRHLYIGRVLERDTFETDLLFSCLDVKRPGNYIKENLDISTRNLKSFKEYVAMISNTSYRDSNRDNKTAV